MTNTNPFETDWLAAGQKMQGMMATPAQQGVSQQQAGAELWTIVAETSAARRRRRSTAFERVRAWRRVRRRRR